MNSGDVSHTYTITFDKDQMIVNCTTSILLNEGFKHIKSTTKINILDIDNISVLIKEQAVWLTIRIKDGKKITNIKADGSVREDIEFNFVLDKSFNEEKLPERIKKAFSRLIELNGGNPTFLNDKF